jgi:Tfp pilus assembly protein PilF
MKLAPDRPEPWLGLGGLSLHIDRLDEAREQFGKALELDERCTGALAGLARVDIEDGRFAEADALLRRAEAIDEDSRSVLRARAEFLFRTKDITGATRIYRRILEIEPKDLGAHQRLANGFLELDHALWSPPPVPPAYGRAVDKAVEKYRHLELDEAEEALAALDTRDAPDARPAFYRGLIRLRRGKTREAIALLWRALDRDPANYLVRNALAVAYREKISSQRAEYGGGEDGVDRLRPLARAQKFEEIERVGRIVHGYDRLLPAERQVILRAVEPVTEYLGVLQDNSVQHDVLGFEEGMCDAPERRYLALRRTHDGRWYGGLRGVGGRSAATGIEAILGAADLRYDTFAHEFAHQVHRYGLTNADKREIAKLYGKAMAEDRCLDYYAASNEREYFAQGYEAFVSLVKSPYTHTLRRHTRAELADRDPALFDLIRRVTHTPANDHRLRPLAAPILAFYEWADDAPSLASARRLFTPYLEPAAEPK